MEMWTETRRQEKPSTRDFVGAEDGIRTRDPHLGKVFEIVYDVRASPLNCTPSTECPRTQPGFVPVVVRTTTDF
jgi:hypothetical protein